VETNNYIQQLADIGQHAAVFSHGLIDEIKKDPNIVILTPDATVKSPKNVGNEIKVELDFCKVKEVFPDNFHNVGIAEQNFLGMAAGICSEGFKVVAQAQACFISMRSFEQVRQYAGYMKIPLILIGIGSGLGLTFYGNTHYAIEDYGILKTIPGLTIVAPSDSLQAIKATHFALEGNKPVYIRLYGGKAPVVYDKDFDFALGKVICLREGTDIQIIAAGSMVYPALQVAEKLKLENIDAQVIDMHTIKPLDTTAINQNCKLIITIEEHTIINGLGSSVADYLASFSIHPPLLKIGIEDTFSSVGDYAYLLHENGLSENLIADKILRNYKSCS
jgi:transketolase